MARIIAPVPGLNETGVGGLTFVDSIAHTDNPAIIEYCRVAGYTVETSNPAGSDPHPSKKWSVKRLKQFATDRGVDLGDAKTKDEILAVLTPAGEPPAGTPLTPEELEAAEAAAAKPETTTVPPSDTTKP